jgi:hypothetical protein
MIAFATMSRIAQSRGQDVFLWYLAYLVLLAMAICLSVALKSILVVVVFESLFTLTFLLSYHLYSDETKAELEKKADGAAVVAARQEAFQASLAEWEVVKVYADSSQERELRQDRAILDHHGVRSFVKTAGITTIMVHRDHLERASGLLGIVAPEDTGTEEPSEEVR